MSNYYVELLIVILLQESQALQQNVRNYCLEHLSLQLWFDF